MEPCCCADDYARMFGRSAAREAKTFRRRGLRGTAADLARGIERTGVDGASILEVGGGVGGLHVHLLERGAASAVTVELSPAYEAAATQLLVDRGLGDHVERRVGDFVATRVLEPADVVVLHRVVCCYPDWQAMLDRSADLATRVVGLTFPRDWWPGRAAVGFGNGLCRISGMQFRAFVHPADAMLASLSRRGFRVCFDEVGMMWRSVVMARAVR